MVAPSRGVKASWVRVAALMQSERNTRNGFNARGVQRSVCTPGVSHARDERGAWSGLLPQSTPAYGAPPAVPPFFREKTAGSFGLAVR
jgi:hypothetical protein